MRTVFISLLLLCCVGLQAQRIDRKVAGALEQIKQGNITEGVGTLKSAAGSNSAEALFYMGMCYEYGISVEKSDLEAFKMYRQAAEHGLPDAMYRLATFYHKGIGVGRNEASSEEWMSRYQGEVGVSQLPDFIAIYNEGLNMARRFSGDEAQQPLTFGNAGTTSTASVATAPPATSSGQSIIFLPALNYDRLSRDTVPQSDIDRDIPTTAISNPKTFVVVIANENYQEEGKVDFAIHDGQTFSEYCRLTLGIPKENIHFRKDATYNNIRMELDWMEQVAKAYKGKANFIFYYAGHGFPDEATRAPYLLPVDGSGSVPATGYSLGDLYKLLGAMPSKGVVVLLDACFSGAQRGDGMLASARGIALKAKEDVPPGKLLVFSAASGQQTAYPYKEKGHGLFTYYLLKELKATQGNVTFGEIADYVSEHVDQQSVVINSKPQNPMVIPSESLAKTWRSMHF